MNIKELLQASVYERAEVLTKAKIIPSFLPITVQEELIGLLSLLKRRSVSLVKCSTKGRIQRYVNKQDQEEVEYLLHTEYLLKQEDFFYIQESVEERCLVVKGEKIIKDYSLVSESFEDEVTPLQMEEEDEERKSFKYNRLEAVKYAELWWNDNNPDYIHFKDNCTNYISQCLRAGGAPMGGHPNALRGWWCNGKKWSLSWSTPHSLRWYLSGAKVGLRGKEMERANDLLLGDLIFYDFTGDGKWDHCTIVVGKDKDGMPLVNAHTINCRFRYWTYEDSHAYTKKTKYKFFRIVG